MAALIFQTILLEVLVNLQFVKLISLALVFFLVVLFQFDVTVLKIGHSFWRGGRSFN